jgi:hypothetical protein
LRIKGVHKVTARGITYCYAWRGGPRMKLMPDDPGFEAEYDALPAPNSVPATGKKDMPGRRKVVLRTSARARLSVSSALKKALDNARQRARDNGLPFDLTIGALQERLTMTGERCELSGIPFRPQYDIYGRLYS